tara:strand:- start:247 stop:423 length:177 start_codon:yes stop_codon:yes gene_type:complete
LLAAALFRAQRIDGGRKRWRGSRPCRLVFPRQFDHRRRHGKGDEDDRSDPRQGLALHR